MTKYMFVNFNIVIVLLQCILHNDDILKRTAGKVSLSKENQFLIFGQSMKMYIFVAFYMPGFAATNYANSRHVT